MNLLDAFSRMQQCRDLSIFYRRWAAATGAGLPLRESLAGLTEDSVAIINARVRYLAAAIDRGDLSFTDNPDVFTAIEVAFIDVGMNTGNLDGALDSLANMYDADYRTVRRAKRKSAYPLLVAFLACWLPTLPIIFHVGIWAWVSVGLLCSGAVFTFGGVALWSYFVWVRGTKRWAQVRFFWGMATAIEAGLYLDDALRLAAEVTAPSGLAKRMRYVVPKGRPLTELLRASGAFDEGALTMISSGEVSGNLPTSLRQAAKYLEDGTL